MELKEATSRLVTLLNVNTVKDIPKALKQKILSNDTTFYDAYTQSFDEDMLQHVYQFWLADIGKVSKNQYFTPKSLAKLVTAAVIPDSGVVYDCCAGVGMLTIAMHKQNTSLHFVCEELDGNTIPFLLANLIMHNVTAIVFRGDVLKNETYAAYKVQATEKYSTVSSLDDYKLEKYDAVISNPPYNVAWYPDLADERFTDKPMPSSNANYMFVYHCLHHLKDNAAAALILPNSVLVGESEKEIRKYVMNTGLLSGILAIPGSMFESTGISTTVMVFKQGRNDDGVEMIDASRLCSEKIREQRGEAHNAKRIYKKKLAVFDDIAIEHIMNLLKNHVSEAGISAFASLQNINNQEYNLSPKRYIVAPEQTATHRSFQDIGNDLRTIAEEKLRVKVTLNKTWAAQLGWKEVAELCEQSEETIKEMNEGIFKLLGIDPMPVGSFVKVSNSKEFKIENVSKDAISSIFMIFMPMLKQHIYYLNQRENMLLAEMRDAALPELMSGKIETGQDIEQQGR